MWLLKISLIFVFLLIFKQDINDRLVYWFLFPLIGILSYAIQAITIGNIPALINSTINLIFIVIILFISFLYSKIKMKMKFINGTIGLGDILLFIFLSFTFSTISFFVIFVFSLLFSVLLHIVYKNTSKHNNIPLAGYVSLFFASVYFVSIFLTPKHLYS